MCMVNVMDVKQEQAANNLKIMELAVNAQKAESEAAYERQEGLEESRKVKLNAIKNMGNIKSKMAASNLVSISGTALNLYDDEKSFAELSAIDILDKSEKKAGIYLDKARDYYNQIHLTRINYKNAYIKAITKDALALAETFCP